MGWRGRQERQTSHGVSGAGLQMTPTTIASKARALKAHLDRIAPDVEASRHDLARRDLASLQRQTVLLLRLVELQLSGAAGEPRHSQKRRAGVNQSEGAFEKP
jgi:hypothetical protein